MNWAFTGGKKMSCQAMDSWTFTELVGAFLDLAIAYFLLCGSTSAYFTSKFLGLFGLSLPCPCNGYFGKRDSNKPKQCVQGLLVDYPSEKISDVQFLVKTKFPLSSILTSGPNSQSTLKLLNEKGPQSGNVGLEGETSCGSSKEFIGRKSSAREKGFSLKAKVVTSQRSIHGIRHRRKYAMNNDKSPSVSSYNPLLSDSHSLLESPASVSKSANEIMACSLVDPGNMGAEDFDSIKDDICIPLGSDDALNEQKGIRKDVSDYEDFQCYLRGRLDFDSNEKDTIRILEQALEEEHAARSALCLELEKERNAAATAADEAMAMILRLQEEKAAVEMDARQYKRMVEEKSTYDAEEMNILKEILVRREREKHFLEKEVKALRQLSFGIEQLDVEMDNTAATQAQRLSSSIHSSEDPVLMQPHVNGSIDKKVEVKYANNFPEDEGTSVGLHDYTLALGKKLPVPEGDEDVHEKTITSIGEEQNKLDDIDVCQGLILDATETSDDTKISIPCDEGKMEKHGKYSRSLMLDRDLSIHDVHVIGDEFNRCDETSEKVEDPFNNLTLDIPKSCVRPIINSLGAQVDMTRSTSDIFDGLQHNGFSKSKAILSDMRRNSMSALDYERLKIDSEVGRLWERLRIVQEGREKLKLSEGNFESNKVQLQMLEDISTQLREIRQATELGVARRQAPLKKRHWRSVSFVAKRST